MLTRLKGFKTILFNIVMTVVMALRLWQPDTELPDETAVAGAVDALDAALTAIWGVGNMLLRSITDSPIFKKQNGSTTNSPALVGILALLLAALIVVGCGGTKAAYKAASGVEETAYVLVEHYYALVRQANELADSGQLVGSSLTRAQDVVRLTKPVVDEAIRASLAYVSYKDASSEADLKRAISDAAIAISRLVDAIKGAVRSTGLTDSIERDILRLRAQHSFMRVAA